MAQEKKTNEIRQDVIGRKVVITVVRRDRPQDDKTPARIEKGMPPEKCFFCPGNEHLTPPEIDRMEHAPGKWEIRCFANKFPAFSLESKKAYGRHEIIVETPEHKKSLSESHRARAYAFCSPSIPGSFQSHSFWNTFTLGSSAASS